MDLSAQAQPILSVQRPLARASDHIRPVPPGTAAVCSLRQQRNYRASHPVSENCTEAWSLTTLEVPTSPQLSPATMFSRQALLRSARTAAPQRALLGQTRTFAAPASTDKVKPPIAVFGLDGTYATALVRPPEPAQLGPSSIPSGPVLSEGGSRAGQWTRPPPSLPLPRAAARLPRRRPGLTCVILLCFRISTRPPSRRRPSSRPPRASPPSATCCRRMPS